MPVLIITERDDIHGHALIWALDWIGVRCDRWSLSEFPEEQRTSVRISNSSLPLRSGYTACRKRITPSGSDGSLHQRLFPRRSQPRIFRWH